MTPPNDWIENSEDVKEYQERYPFVYGAIIVTFIILIGRLWYLQIIRGSELKRFSEKNQIKEQKIQAPRGMLLDRDGQILVDNLPTFNVTLTPQYLISLDKTSQELSVILKIKKEGIIDKVKSSRKQNGIFKPVAIKENVSRDEVAMVERLKFDTPGLKVVMGIKRNYLLSDNGAQIFGYTGEISKEELPVLNASRTPDNKLRSGDVIGKSGLEKRWDAEIRGVDGERFVSVDAREREVAVGRDLILTGYPESTDSIPGRNLVLTIDKDLQATAYESMKRNKQIGSVVAIDPNTGEILSLLNAPSFDPNHFSTGIPPDIWAQLVNDPFKPLRNKVIQDHFPPGSTFKAIVALAALQEKVITINSSYHCGGFMKFGRRDYHCWKKHGHGRVNVFQALESSCDVFFYHVGLQLGIDRIAKYARKLGMGTRTGILLDNERSGLVPDTDWKKKTLGEEWQPGENLSNAIGQGFMLLTPLQMVTIYSAIGLDGLVNRPYIIKKIQDIDGNSRQEFGSKTIRNVQSTEDGNDAVISLENFEIVKTGLSRVFQGDHGTAQAFKIPGLEIAGKTGTVQLFTFTKEQVFAKCEARELKQRNNGWLVAFAPKDKPKFAVAVHVEHGCHGTTAGPIVKDMMLAYFRKYAPEYLKTYDEKMKKAGKIVVPAKEAQ
ncbi:MAG: penicillin-binding protein 2 [Oligoflexia bacterium]|nr:penicillin-binding protein 2 [Oligoflexia bacterium]